MASKPEFERVAGAGWLSGFWNMLRKENSRWLKTRKWLVQSVVWLLLLNGLVTLILALDSDVTIGSPGGPPMESPSTVELFFILMGAMTPFGVLILTQSDIVGEKQSGTAEWVLSSPLSREAFVLSKLVANSAWILALLVLLQGIAFNMILMAFGVKPVPVSNLLGGLALNGLHVIFWIAFSLMLGTFFKGRGPVLGIPIVIMAFQDVIAEFGSIYVPWIPLILPERLPELATLAAGGNPLYSSVPIVVASVCSIAFVATAVWRFKREEF